MKKISAPPLEGQVLIAPRNDDGKKIYRAISEVARRLDISRSNTTSISELFDFHIEIQRIKLRDGCEKLLFAEPLLFGRKAQELLWRKTYYDVINTAKKLLNKHDISSKERDKLILHNHIDSGIGYYNHFLFKLQSEFNLDLHGIVDFPIKNTTPSTHLSSEVKRWAYICAHSCLISLGDLNRYKLELDNFWGLMNAERFYKQAIYLDSRIGMPYNQLGTLSGSVNYHLDAVYFYIHCLLSPQPFDGAENNLKLIFEKNQSYVDTVDDQNDHDHIEHIKICISRFLHLFEIWIFNKRYENINDLCHAAINDFKECLLYMEPLPENFDDTPDASAYLQKENAKRHPEYLDGDIVFKISVICIMCVQKLQDISSSHVSLVKAFTLAILLELINFVNDNIEEYMYAENEKLKHPEKTETEENPEKKEAIEPDAPPVEENKNTDLELSVESKVESAVKRNNRRRRRRYYSETSSDEHSSSESDTDCSDNSSEASDNCVLNDDSESSEEDDSDNDIIIEDIEELSPTLDIENSVKELINRKPIQNIINNADLSDDDKNKECKSSDQSFELLQENNTICETNFNVENNEAKTLSEINENVDQNIVVPRYPKYNRRTHRLGANEIIMFCEKEQVLNSIKILCDWLRGDMDLIKSCAKNSPNFIHRLVHLLNSLNIDVFSKSFRERFGTVLLVEDSKFEIEMLKETNEFVPLPEDHELRGIHILENSHFVIDWDYHKKMNKTMCLREECIYRILKLINFGFFLTKIKFTNVQFNGKNRYFMERKEFKNMKNKKQKKYKLIKKKFKKTRSRSYMRKHFEELHFQDNEEIDVMENMGRLWLKNQVRTLETVPPAPKKQQVTRVRKPVVKPIKKALANKVISPFIVVDSKCLMQHAHKIKQIVLSKLTIVVIPKTVMSFMDLYKRESNNARGSIRWLEGQILRGNRHLRGQRSKEHLSLHRITMPKKMDKDAYDYVQILELCNYLATYGEEEQGTNINGFAVTFLTGPDLSDFSSRDFSLTGLAKSINVNVEKIAVFYAKFRHVLSEALK